MIKPSRPQNARSSEIAVRWLAGSPRSRWSGLFAAVSLVAGGDRIYGIVFVFLVHRTQEMAYVRRSCEPVESGKTRLGVVWRFAIIGIPWDALAALRERAC